MLFLEIQNTLHSGKVKASQEERYFGYGSNYKEFPVPNTPNYLGRGLAIKDN